MGQKAVSDNQSSSVTLNELVKKARKTAKMPEGPFCQIRAHFCLKYLVADVSSDFNYIVRSIHGVYSKIVENM